MCPSRPSAEPGRALRLLLLVWIVALSALILGPTLAPGYVLSYDMVWVPDLSVTRPDLWGLGSGLPRAVPSDALVALLGVIVPQQLLQKAILLGSLVAAGCGGARLTRGLGTPAQWAAATVLVWNPFVAERLGIGHWPLLLAYAAVPWLVVAVRERRFAAGALLLAVTALTPASGVMGLVVALVMGRLHDAWRWILLAVAVNAPWIVASLVSPASLTSDPFGVAVFAARGAGTTPVWLEVATLGGVWNSDVRPPSRESVVATVVAGLVLALVVFGLVRLWRTGGAGLRPLVALWGIGFVAALAGVVAPSLLAELVGTIPGAGLVRDGSRWVVLMAPATAMGLGAAVAWLTERPASTVVGWMVALLVPIAMVPDLGWGLAGRLQAVDYPAEWDHVASALADQEGPGDVVSLPFSAFRAPEWNDGRPVLDPAGRYFDRVTVTDDTLRVGAIAIAGEDPRAARVGLAVEAGDWPYLAAEGIGFLVLDSSAPGPESVVRRVSALPLLAHEGDLWLYEVPGDVRDPSGDGRTSAVVVGWSIAGATVLGAAVAQIGRRRKITRGT
ncbi:hypothetical protein [Aeromicrobium sp.]|uniref:hypothetical protein n=1 Tax=Aeromicrobium sp. TaxID=1871063 RepID=UPI0028A68C21|nr:hypothetical protein [Aeromicrobium sp.]